MPVAIVPTIANRINSCVLGCLAIDLIIDLLLMCVFKWRGIRKAWTFVRFIWSFEVLDYLRNSNKCTENSRQ